MHYLSCRAICHKAKVSASNVQITNPLKRKSSSGISDVFSTTYGFGIYSGYFNSSQQDKLVKNYVYSSESKAVDIEHRSIIGY
jgi:hypothetical protein